MEIWIILAVSVVAIVGLVLFYSGKMKAFTQELDNLRQENEQHKASKSQLKAKVEFQAEELESVPILEPVKDEVLVTAGEVGSENGGGDYDILLKEKEKWESKYKKIWQTSLSVHKQKEQMESLNSQLEAQKGELENAHKDISAKNAKLWKTSLLINKQKEEVERIKEEIAEKNKHITDSIRYAQIIQQAILPPRREIYKGLEKSFVYFRPKDLVSGDFYWYADIGKWKKDCFVIAAVDCTGHGVPGAFMSMIGNELFNSLVMEKKITDVGEVLTKLQMGIKFALRKDRRDTDARDGMDVALAMINIKTRELEFSGANNPVYILRKTNKTKDESGKVMDLEEVKGNKAIQFDEGNKFDKNKIQLAKGDSFYLFSDGYADQFGGDKGKKFKYSQFKQLLVANVDKSMEEQEKILDDTMLAWRDGEEQIDDILVIGVQV